MKKDNKTSEKIYDIEEYRRKKKARTIRNRIIIGVVVVFLLAITYAGVYFYQNYDLQDLIENAKDTTQVDDNTTLGENFPVSLSGIQPISLTSSGYDLILLTSDEEMFYNSGNAGHHFIHRFTNPVIKEVDGRVLTYDRGGYAYRIDSSSGLHLSDRTDNIILTATISDKKSYAFVTKEQRYAGSVTVFSKSNEEILKWYSASEQIADIAISADERYLAVLCVGFENGNICSKVYIIDLKRKTDSEKATLIYSNTVPVAIDYKKNGQIHIVTDSSIVVVGKDFNTRQEIPYSNSLKKYCFSSNATYVLTSDVNSVSCSVLMTDGKINNTVTLNVDAIDVSHNGRNLYVLGRNQIKVLDKELFLKGTLSVANDVYGIEAIGNRIYLLASNALDVMSANIPKI